VTNKIFIKGVFCVTKPVRKSAVWLKFNLIVGDALTAATAAAISGTSIPVRYLGTFKSSSISAIGGSASQRTELISL
jgi:hypothetical protein